MRKFFRSPALMMVSMVFPLVQLIVLGYAFGGKIKGADVGVRGPGPFRRIAHGPRNVSTGIEAGPQTFHVVEYRFAARCDRLICGRDSCAAWWRFRMIFRGAFYQHDRPRIAFTEDNTDQFISSVDLERVQQMVDQLEQRRT